jgi:hypothetical protein
MLHPLPECRADHLGLRSMCVYAVWADGAGEPGAGVRGTGAREPSEQVCAAGFSMVLSSLHGIKPGTPGSDVSLR